MMHTNANTNTLSCPHYLLLPLSVMSNTYSFAISENNLIMIWSLSLLISLSLHLFCSSASFGIRFTSCAMILVDHGFSHPLPMPLLCLYVACKAYIQSRNMCVLENIFHALIFFLLQLLFLCFGF